VLTVSQSSTAAKTNQSITVTNLGGSTTNGSNQLVLNGQGIKTGSTTEAPTAGWIIAGNGIGSNNTISSVSGDTITLCSNATTTTNTMVSLYKPITWSNLYNAGSPVPGSSTTSTWGGCVVEPTSTDENASGNDGALAQGSDPDTSQPTSGLKWYPLWWPSGLGANNWSTLPSTLSVQKQDATKEAQGDIGAFDALDGPNQGCPAPILPLVDLTSTTGQGQIGQAISNMWPKDADGTQVHIGLTWGWRVLDPNGPFAANNGHPLDYTTATQTGWKKIVVLMTDGSEEWPTTGEYTGLGTIYDGKIGTTSTTIAANTAGTSKLDDRLSTLCTNVQSLNITMYTIGLAADGQSNTILKNCASTVNGKQQFYKAGPPNGDTLSNVFNEIANSIIELRLTK
jgi:hypothetical protein